MDARKDPLFDRLRKVLAEHEASLELKQDRPGHYELSMGYLDRWKREICFGAVKTGKSGVSYHVMALGCPGLIDGMSDGLRARLSGKTCFRFQAIDDAQIEELAALTRDGLERFRKYLAGGPPPRAPHRPSGARGPKGKRGRTGRKS